MLSFPIYRTAALTSSGRLIQFLVHDSRARLDGEDASIGANSGC
jgi:hypothetical protein